MRRVSGEPSVDRKDGDNHSVNQAFFVLENIGVDQDWREAAIALLSIGKWVFQSLVGR
jgi:hypothetical protein